MNSRILLLAPAKASQHSMQEKLYSAITKSLVEQEVLRFEIGPGAEQASLESEKTTLNHAIESIGNAAIEKVCILEQNGRSFRSKMGGRIGENGWPVCLRICNCSA